MKQRATEKTIWIALALLSPALPLQLYFGGNWYALLHSYSLGMVFGILSYTYFLNALIIASRIRYFDRVFGHDRILVFHGYLAFTAFVFAQFHFAFKRTYVSSPTIQSALGVGGLAIFTLIVVVTGLFMIDSFLHKIPVVRAVKHFAVKRLGFDYSRLKFFHNFTAAASVLIAIHVFLAYSTQENLERKAVMMAWATIAVALYIHHKFLRGILGRGKKFSLAKISTPAEGIVQLELNAVSGPLRGHKAGQFAYFKFLSSVCGRAEHPFTISSPPKADALTITVKNLGDYTARLRHVPIGTRVVVDGPYGVFTPVQDGNPHLFVAGGIGVTPFLSILHEWKKRGITHSTTLVWSVKAKNDLIHADELSALQRSAAAFRFVPVITREDAGEIASRIDRTLLEKVIIPTVRKTIRVYVCGPDSLRRGVVAIVQQLGVPRARIHFERFSF